MYSSIDNKRARAFSSLRKHLWEQEDTTDNAVRKRRIINGLTRIVREKTDWAIKETGKDILSYPSFQFQYVRLGDCQVSFLVDAGNLVPGTSNYECFFIELYNYMLKLLNDRASQCLGNLARDMKSQEENITWFRIFGLQWVNNINLHVTTPEIHIHNNLYEPGTTKYLLGVDETSRGEILNVTFEVFLYRKI